MTTPRPLLRILLGFAAAVALVHCQAETAPLTPLAWTKVAGPGPNGALLGPGAAGAFDERANFTTGALPDGATVRLYYGGSDATGACAGITGSHWRIGLAESTDGVELHPGAGDARPAAPWSTTARPGQFDSQLTYRPCRAQGRRRSTACGSTAAPCRSTARPARSPTTGASATPSRPTASPGPSTTTATGPAAASSRSGPLGAIDAQQVGYVWVLKDGAEYKMYYSANDATNTWRVALATSTDARHWTKVPGKLAGGAILDVGPAGSFDFACAYQPSVVKERDQLYRMWYRGCVAPGPFGGPSKGTIGYAESNDGITWVKIPQPRPDGSALGVGPARPSTRAA